jgi:hypothetical protein
MVGEPPGNSRRLAISSGNLATNDNPGILIEVTYDLRI